MRQAGGVNPRYRTVGGTMIWVPTPPFQVRTWSRWATSMRPRCGVRC